MKKSLLLSAVTVSFLLIVSCASIVSKSNWPVSINSNPTGAAIAISNRNGTQVYKGETPATVTLKSSAGFFKKESYKIRFELAGYADHEVPLECRVNGWYWGNILLGGVVGMLIIDPATGAMYKLNSDMVDESLAKSTTSTKSGSDLKIYAITDLPESLKGRLVKIN